MNWFRNVFALAGLFGASAFFLDVRVAFHDDWTVRPYRPFQPP